MEQNENKRVLDARGRAGYLLGGEDAMAARPDIEALKVRGAGRPAPAAVVALYDEAFARFGVRALWSRRPSPQPTIAQALVVAEGLRREGDMRARPLAARIEDACRAAL